jgi:hypothetical protein
MIDQQLVSLLCTATVCAVYKDAAGVGVGTGVGFVTGTGTGTGFGVTAGLVSKAAGVTACSAVLASSISEVVLDSLGNCGAKAPSVTRCFCDAAYASDSASSIVFAYGARTKYATLTITTTPSTKDANIFVFI